MGTHSDQTKGKHNLKLSTKWWKSHWFGMMIAVIVAVGLSIVIIFTLNNARDETTSQDESDFANDPKLLSGSVDDLKNVAKLADSIEEKANAYLSVGNEYDYQGKPDKALVYYKRAEQLAPTDRAVLMALADYYQEVGSNKKAISYIQKIIAGLDATNPLFQADKESYEELIEELNAQ